MQSAHRLLQPAPSKSCDQNTHAGGFSSLSLCVSVRAEESCPSSLGGAGSARSKTAALFLSACDFISRSLSISACANCIYAQTKITMLDIHKLYFTVATNFPSHFCASPGRPVGRRHSDNTFQCALGIEMHGAHALPVQQVHVCT